MKMTLKSRLFPMMLSVLIVCLTMSAPGMSANGETTTYGKMSAKGRLVEDEITSRNIQFGQMAEVARYTDDDVYSSRIKMLADRTVYASAPTIENPYMSQSSDNFVERKILLLMIVMGFFILLASVAREIFMSGTP